MERSYICLLIVFTLAAGLSCSKGSEPGATTAPQQTSPVASVPGIATIEPGDKQSGSGPTIEFVTDTYEFGTVKGGEEVSHMFVFENKGDRQLQIKDVKPGCGCTLTGQWTKTVEPGEKGVIPVKLNTQKLAAGNVSKEIKVFTNTRGQSLISVWMKGTIWLPVEITHRTLNWGSSFNGNDAVTRSVRIRNNLEDPMEITSVKSDSPVFSPELKIVKPGREFEILVTTVPPVPTGPKSAKIHITTSNPEKPEIIIQVRAYVRPPIHVVPSRVQLPSSPLTSPFQRAIYITNSTEDPMTISDLQTGSDQISTKVEETAPGKKIRILLSFPEGFELPTDSTMSLSFKTGNPTVPEIDIPISLRPARATRGARAPRVLQSVPNPSSTPLEGNIRRRLSQW